MHFKMVLLKENFEYALDNTSEHDDSKVGNVTLIGRYWWAVDLQLLQAYFLRISSKERKKIHCKTELSRTYLLQNISQLLLLIYTSKSSICKFLVKRTL